MNRSIKTIRCDECEKEIHDNNYYVDYFGFVMCPECKENDSWMDEVIDNENTDFIKGMDIYNSFPKLTPDYISSFKFYKSKNSYCKRLDSYKKYKTNKGVR